MLRAMRLITKKTARAGQKVDAVYGNQIMVKRSGTGADGFIGSHLTEQLVRAGHDVRAFVYYNAFNSGAG